MTMSVPESVSGVHVWMDEPDAMVLPMLVTQELLVLDRRPLGSSDSDLAAGWEMFTLYCDIVDGWCHLTCEDE